MLDLHLDTLKFKSRNFRYERAKTDVRGWLGKLAMHELSNLLAAATAAIEPGYFRLSIHGGLPVYRERVYCYELYHQMRSRWPDDCDFSLNGEVDKVAHPILSELGAGGFKPDLLVHHPGDMGGNHAVLEVKSARAARNGFSKDLNTLSVFRRDVGYQRAIYLVYGEEVSDRLIESINRFHQQENFTLPIELWLHTTPKQPAIHALTMERPTASHR